LVYLLNVCKPGRFAISGEIIMRYLLFTFLCVSFLSTIISAQTRQQAIDNLSKLKEEAVILEKIILSPDKQDIESAEKEKVNVFRILPQGKTEKGNLYSVRGGGSYYSFSKQSHSYNEIPQIELQKDIISVGFAGVDYGFIADLGEISLADIGEKTNGYNYLMDYQPATIEPQGRIEQHRSSTGFDADGILFKRNLPEKIGHSYLLRAISYDQADVMVAFKVQRKDADGSLIIFWKPIKQFDKPVLNR
jgi:hypothetical protein